MLTFRHQNRIPVYTENIMELYENKITGSLQKSYLCYSLKNSSFLFFLLLDPTISSYSSLSLPLKPHFNPSAPPSLSNAQLTISLNKLLLMVPITSHSFLLTLPISPLIILSSKFSFFYLGFSSKKINCPSYQKRSLTFFLRPLSWHAKSHSKETASQKIHPRVALPLVFIPFSP